MGILINFCAGVEERILPAQKVRAILVNVPYNGVSEKLVRDTLQMLQVAGSEHVMLDSGGYQLLQNEIKGVSTSYNGAKPLIFNKDQVNLAPIHVVQAAAQIKPNIVMALDRPIATFKEQAERDLEFKRKLGFNLIWMRETAELKKKHGLNAELFLPVQCYDLSQFEYVERQLVGLEYDGFSMPIRNLSPAGIAIFLIKFYKMGIRKIHLLGVTNFPVIALSAYFARHFFDWFSLDSTTWRLAAEYQLYLDPQNLSTIKVTNDIIFPESKRIICGCPWCRGMTFTKIKDLPYTDKVSFLRSHDFFTIENTVTTLFAQAITPDNFISYLRGQATTPTLIKKVDKVIQALSMAENLKNLDI